MEEAKTYYSKSKTSKKYINNFKHFLLDILGLEEVINSYLDFEKYNKIINNYQESNNNISYNNSNIFNNKFISFKNISENITYNKYKCQHCVKIQNKNEKTNFISRGDDWICNIDCNGSDGFAGRKIYLSIHCFCNNMYERL